MPTVQNEDLVYCLSMTASLFIRTRMYMRFTLPDIDGEIVAATLNIKCVSVSNPGIVISTTPYLGLNATWLGETNLSGVSLYPNPAGPSLDVGGIGWYSWNILGSPTGTRDGILDVYADTSGSPGDITAVVDYSGVATTTAPGLMLGNVFVSTDKGFDGSFSNPGPDSADSAYIEITYEEGAGEGGLLMAEAALWLP